MIRAWFNAWSANCTRFTVHCLLAVISARMIEFHFFISSQFNRFCCFDFNFHSLFIFPYNKFILIIAQLPNVVLIDSKKTNKKRKIKQKVNFRSFEFRKMQIYSVTAIKWKERKRSMSVRYWKRDFNLLITFISI